MSQASPIVGQSGKKTWQNLREDQFYLKQANKAMQIRLYEVMKEYFLIETMMINLIHKQEVQPIN